MSGQDHLGEAINAVMHHAQEFSKLYGTDTQGWIANPLKRLGEELRAELGLFGQLIGGVISTAVCLGIWAIATAMLFWATLGSMLVLVTVPEMLFGRFNPPMNALPVGIIFAILNALITVAAMGFIFHGFAQPSGRSVYGNAHFADEKQAAKAAGLTSTQDRRARS